MLKWEFFCFFIYQDRTKILYIVVYKIVIKAGIYRMNDSSFLKEKRVMFFV